MDTKINELPLFMMPESEARLSYNDSLLLYDNLDKDYDETYENIGISSLPLKLKFALVLFCHKGEIQITANLAELVLHSGDNIILIPDTIISSFHMSTDCRLAVICLSAETGANLIDTEMTRLLLQNVYSGPIKVQLPDEYSRRFLDLYRLIRHWVTLPDFRFTRKAIQGSFIAMSSLVCNQMDELSVQPASRQEAIFHQFMKEVHEHYREHRDLSFYADRMCMSAKYLGRSIHDYSGHRASDIIKDYVILEAKAMLRSKQYTVMQIADALHFTTASFFGRYFRENVGCSPLQY